MAIVAIDQGTTSTRALVLNEDGSTHIARAIEHRQIYPQSGWVEHDPEELLANLLACAEAAAGCAAIGIDNQGESCLAWDGETKEAITPVIVWQDTRTEPQIDRLKADGAEALVLDRAGLPLDSYFSASKLAWILKEVPEARRLHAAGRLRLGTTDAFFLDRLTGRFVTDVTTASRTSLMNLGTRTWDPELCDLFGVPSETLPEIVPSTGDFGTLTLDQGSVPVVASIVDQQAALYGHGCRRPGDTKVTFGTGAFALTVTGPDILRAPEEGLLPTIAWQKSGEAPVYALDGGIYTASAAVNWAERLGLFDGVSDLDTLSGPSAIESGLVFVPALSGLACPHWDRAARGAWFGLSLDHGSKDLTMAVLEGVAFRAAEVISAMQARSGADGPLSIDGGLTNNAYFNGFLADILEREIRVSREPELTARGTAELVADCLGMVIGSPAPNTVLRPEQERSGARKKFAEAVRLARAWGETGRSTSRV